MIQGIDHVVIFVANLDTAVAEAESAGFTVTPGGHHRESDTHNALIAFADGVYLELLAFTTQPDQDHYFAARYQQGPGFADFALRSTDIDRDVEASAAGGVSYPLPTHLSRQRPDGEVASWRMSLPQVLQPGTAYPFLMQDLSSRETRVPSDSSATTHANGAIGVAGLSVVIEDLPSYHRATQIILRHLPQDQARFRATRGIAQLPLDTDGRQIMAILQPTVDSVPGRHFDTFGNSIYAIHLRTRLDDPLALGVGELIQLPALGGARIYLQS